MATTALTSTVAPRVAQTAQEIAAAKLKLTAQQTIAAQKAAATAATKPPPILATGKVSTPKPAAPKIVLPPGINFAALKATDDANKALMAKSPGGKMVNGYYLPPGINFAALKATDDAAKAAAKPPVDPLQATYDKFSATMATQSKDTSALYDKVMKEITDMYGTADKSTDTSYASTLKSLKDMVTNIGGPGLQNQLTDVTANQANLKSMNAQNLASTKASIDMLKSSIPGMFSSISQGTMGDLQQAMLDRAAAVQAAAAAKAGSGGGGGGGGGGRRSSGRRSSGSGSSSGKKTSYTDTANESLTSVIGDVDAINRLPANLQGQAWDIYNHNKRNVNSAIGDTQDRIDAAAAKIVIGIPQLFGGKGQQQLNNARNNNKTKAQVSGLQQILGALNSFSGSGGSAKGTRNVKSASSSKYK